MIFKTAVTDYTGTVFKNLGDHVINTDRIVRPKSVNGSASQFFYTDRTIDRRRKPMPVYCDATLAEVQTAMDAVLASNRMELKIFPNHDTTQNTVSKYIDYSKFIFATAHRLNSNHSWVTFVESFSLSRVLVENTLDQLVDVATEGAPTEDYWDDGVSYFRLQVRSGALYLDQTITDLGWDGSEGTDWDDIWEKSLFL